ncbi:hypothetical protein GCM10011297_32580 [Bacterioplanes sanyensis]|uniref:tetratricopeptide repeat protein n=1 Tax=Bacterioplanes sanyensis TaxID=1249553 RepID=UPI0016724787|nr:hypothetical protein [Bacterioplanes sanyensis]GGY57310.1 hypothetical protein GCM10011297_32580 [Bacterioplanes sanyensis]
MGKVTNVFVRHASVLVTAAGVIVAATGVVVALLGYNLNAGTDEQNREHEIQKLVEETMGLLGLEVEAPGLLLWEKPRGEFSLEKNEMITLEKARRNIDRLSALEDGEDGYHVGLRLIYFLRVGRFDAIDEYINEKFDISGEEKQRLLLLKAMILNNINGIEKESFRIYDELLASADNKRPVRLFYSLALHSHGLNDRAIHQLEKIFSDAPFAPDATDVLVHIYYCSGQMKKAESVLHDFHASGNETVSSRSHLGHIYSNSGDFGFAVDEYHKALLINPEDPALHRLLVHAYEEMGETELAEKHKGKAAFYSATGEQQCQYHYSTH